MKIIVLLKRVPDTEAKILINSEGSGINKEGVKFIINTYDEYAIEEGLQLKEKIGGESTVTVVCMGPEESTEIIRTALAMGADRAVHICDPALEKPTPDVTSSVLAAAIKENGFDIIFCGKQGIDYDMAQTQAFLAEKLDIPQVNVISEFEISEDNKKAFLTRSIEGADEKVEASLPVIISCAKGLNEPRYASLPGIMKAKKKEIRKVTLEDLDLSDMSLENKSTIVKWLSQPKSGECKFIEGEEASEKAAELARVLREEAKVL
ncbi:MAG: electron transfer flavoprotein subunit beta/FixA family protein [Candidatus Krumholzibacteriota bacterium]|nr:electron transfer flavoprotein subunit beta/FixA family protein [Candidatus Krumholzibacteriota bacterium]